MIKEKNIVVEGKHGKPILTDLIYVNSNEAKPVVIFLHGFKGFKDWGPFDLVAENFANAGFCFVKLNFSHNGTTQKNPVEFVDLEAFGNNNFSKELDDLDSVITWLEKNHLNGEQFDLKNISLIGHSRGGGIAILKAHEDARIKKVIGWASVNEFGKYISVEEQKVWKQDGVIYIDNFRTQQKMPLYYQLAEDVFKNPQRLNIKTAVEKLNFSFLIVHGTEDETVSYSDALAMHSWNKKSKLISIEGANHSFGAEHPHNSPYLPAHYQKVVDETITFLCEI